MKNNKGFSLVELLIVVAIMGVLLMFGGVGISVLTSQNVKTASKDAVNILSSAQTASMAKGNVYYIISARDGGGFLIWAAKKGSDEKFISLQESTVKNTVDIQVVTTSSGTLTIGTDSGETPGIVIGFDRGTGAFSGFYLYNKDENKLGSPVGDITDILMSQGSRSYDIALVKETGKYYYK